MAVYAAGSATKRKALVSPPLSRLLATGTTSWGSVTVGTLDLGGGGGGGGSGGPSCALRLTGEELVERVTRFIDEAVAVRQFVWGRGGTDELSPRGGG